MSLKLIVLVQVWSKEKVSWRCQVVGSQVHFPQAGKLVTSDVVTLEQKTKLFLCKAIG